MTEKNNLRDLHWKEKLTPEQYDEWVRAEYMIEPK